MQPEREFARVQGLGRGGRIGFSLILTDQKIVGIDARRRTIWIWLSIMLGVVVGIILALLLVASLEPILFRISPLLDFVTILSLVFVMPTLMALLVPRVLRKRIERGTYPVIEAPKKDITRIEVRKPSKATTKAYFIVRLLNGKSFTFWTVGNGKFDHVNSLLTRFFPHQVSDSSGEPFEDLISDRPNNRFLLSIVVSVVLLIVVGGAILLSYTSLSELIDYLIEVLVIHALVFVGYFALRRIRRGRIVGTQGEATT